MTGIAFATPTFLPPPAGGQNASALAEGFASEESFGDVLNRVEETGEGASVRPAAASRLTAQTSPRNGTRLPAERVLAANPAATDQPVATQPVATEIDNETPDAGKSAQFIESGAGPEDVWSATLQPATDRVPEATGPGVQAPVGTIQEVPLPAVDEDTPEPQANDLKTPVFARAIPEDKTVDTTESVEAGELSETETKEAGPLREPTPVAVSVQIIVPMQVPILRPIADTSTPTSDLARRVAAPLPAPPASPELIPVPEAAVQLRIQTPSELVANDGEVAATALTGAVDPKSVRQIPTESPNSLTVGAGDDEIPTSAPNKVPTDPAARVQTALHEAPAHDRSKGEGGRQPETTKKALPAAVDAAVETIPERNQPESAAAPVVAPRMSATPSHMPTRETPAARAVPADFIPPEPLPKAPLKAISLEFSPGGSADVQLKLSERAGEVHVSLHSSDANLNHQLRNGIGDLASALASAGYEAEAWTSQERGDRQKREQYQPAERQQRKADSNFRTALNESPQEVL